MEQFKNLALLDKIDDLQGQLSCYQYELTKSSDSDEIRSLKKLIKQTQESLKKLGVK